MDTRDISICPFCKGTQVEGDAPDFENNGIRVEMHCLDCEGEWVDVFGLVRTETSPLLPKEAANGRV